MVVMRRVDRMRMRVIAATAVVGLIAAACGGDGGEEPETSSSQTISGSLALQFDGTGNSWDHQGPPGTFKVGDECFGEGGSSDINEGADVTVRNEAGETIALGSLGLGHLEEAFPGGSDRDKYGAFGLACVFPLEVNGVPDARFYSVEVSHRGETSYSRDEMEANSWTVELSLGE
jgi:hypothetical protein